MPTLNKGRKVLVYQISDSEVPIVIPGMFSHIFVPLLSLSISFQRVLPVKSTKDYYFHEVNL